MPRAEASPSEQTTRRISATAAFVSALVFFWVSRASQYVHFYTTHQNNYSK
jgi:hypothetical protein